MSFRIDRGQIIPIPSSKASNIKDTSDIDFQKILQEKIKNNDSVKISAHAKQRMMERDINLQEADMKLINKAMNNLQEKGAKDSLMLYKDMAFIASVQNRTIITALKYKEMEVVTSIDSTIVVE